MLCFSALEMCAHIDSPRRRGPLKHMALVRRLRVPARASRLAVNESKPACSGCFFFSFSRRPDVVELGAFVWQVIRMRNYVDPKRFYKSSDKASKFMQASRVRCVALRCVAFALSCQVQ